MFACPRAMFEGCSNKLVHQNPLEQRERHEATKERERMESMEGGGKWRDGGCREIVPAPLCGDREVFCVETEREEKRERCSLWRQRGALSCLR
jgi:hypothetical protein